MAPVGLSDINGRPYLRLLIIDLIRICRFRHRFDFFGHVFITNGPIIASQFPTLLIPLPRRKTLINNNDDTHVTSHKTTIGTYVEDCYCLGIQCDLRRLTVEEDISI